MKMLSNSLSISISRLALAAVLAVGSAVGTAAHALNGELERYESARALSMPVRGQTATYEHGWRVVERDGKGHATKAQIHLLVDNIGYNNQIYVIGPFNRWGTQLRSGDALRPLADRPHLYSAVIDGLRHETPYRLLLNGKQVLDPAATMYTTREYSQREPDQGPYLNSIFWDVNDPRLYRSRTDFIDVTDRPNLIGEVELHSLVAKFRASNGQDGPRMTAETYRFIAESGVISKLREAGYTTIEMLPFNQSIDGDSWHFRYQVYGLFAPDSRYGNPAEFKMMIDAFHDNGIAVLMDSVISHFPYQGNEGDRRFDGLGWDQWFKADGRQLYVGPASPWGSYRYEYSNPLLRRFLINSITYMMHEYRIDGVRMDNVDGIMGTPGGPQLLKELNVAVREINPRALMIAESFYPPNDLLIRSDWGGYGFNARNDAAFFEIWHKQMQGPTELLTLGRVGEILWNIWDRNEVPLLRYITNHDESANPREGFTGAYPTTLLAGDNYYSFKKIKSADSLNMLVGAFHNSLPQARMMQQGSFYTNAAIDWNLIEGGSGQLMWNYFGALSRYIQSKGSYFNFRSLDREITNHIDDENKIISIKRRDANTGKVLFALINLGHKRIENYNFGIDKAARYKVGFDSEWTGFGGVFALGNSLHGSDLLARGMSVHGKPFSLSVPVVEAYSVTIFEEL